MNQKWLKNRKVVAEDLKTEKKLPGHLVYLKVMVALQLCINVNYHILLTLFTKKSVFYISEPNSCMNLYPNYTSSFQVVLW